MDLAYKNDSKNHIAYINFGKRPHIYFMGTWQDFLASSYYVGENLGRIQFMPCAYKHCYEDYCTHFMREFLKFPICNKVPVTVTNVTDEQLIYVTLRPRPASDP